jgi:hypothetical protein
VSISHNDNGIAIRLEVPLPTIMTTSCVVSSVPGFAIDHGSSTAATVGVTRLAKYASSNDQHAADVAYELDWDLPPLPYQIGNTGNNVSRGFQLTDVTIAYMMSSLGTGTACNGASTMLLTGLLTNFTDSASFSSGVAYGGTFTYNWGSSTGLSSMGSTPSSNMYQVVCVPASGANSFINTDNQRLTFAWTMNSGGGSSMTLGVYNVVIHGKYVTGP